MENYFKGNQITRIGGFVLATECPVCGHKGTFHAIGQDITNGQRVFGMRKCPNTKCVAVVYFVASQDGSLVRTFPPQRIPFDKSNIPESIVETFEEVLSCHSNRCFTAAAIMIRRTLEEICENQEAKGENLKKRIKSLGSIIVIPKELLAGMDDLRLLGNDAAHVKAKSFKDISEEEVTVGIEFTKKILEATYQYETLLSRLRSLKSESIAKAGPRAEA